MPTKDGKPTYDERLIEAGLDALAAGDKDGAADALRLAQEVEAARKTEDEKRREEAPLMRELGISPTA